MTSVVVEVSPDGKITVRVEGVHGPTCVALARHLASLLGVTESEEHTDEFWLLEGLPPDQAARRIGQGLAEGWITPDEARALVERLGFSVESLAAILAGEATGAPHTDMEVEHASGGSVS